MRFVSLRHRLRRFFARPAPAPLETDFSVWKRDVASIAADRELQTHEHHKPNDYYGHATLLKRYIGQPLTHPFRLSIPHGLRFDTKFWDQDYRADYTIGLISSPHRASMIADRVAVKLVPVGPLIHYAPSALTPAAHEAAKTKLGRMLLVFPAHSTHWVDAEFSVDQLIANIAEQGRQYDSTMVCLYWRDIVRGLAEKYRAAGFHVVTAGHMYDAAFLPRLRSIIELATMTMSNRMGTHVGYCIHFGKPHSVLRQEVEIKVQNTEMVRSLGGFDEADLFHQAFGEFSETITPLQREIVEKYWGCSHVKSPAALDELVLAAETEFWRNWRHRKS